VTYIALVFTQKLFSHCDEEYLKSLSLSNESLCATLPARLKMQTSVRNRSPAILAKSNITHDLVEPFGKQSKAFLGTIASQKYTEDIDLFRLSKCVSMPCLSLECIPPAIPLFAIV